MHRPVRMKQLVEALGLQKKPELLEREEVQQQQQEEGMVWLAEKFCNVYQIPNLEPGKASVEDVLAELRKMGVQCVGHYLIMRRGKGSIMRMFSVPGKIEHCCAKAIAEALHLKLVPGCTGISYGKRSDSSSELQVRGMLRLATQILESPRYCRLFGETKDPQKVSKELASKGVWCTPSKETRSGSFMWRFRIKGRPGKLYYKDRLMQELFPEAFLEEVPEDDPA